jgi:hypothetical protein
MVRRLGLACICAGVLAGAALGASTGVRDPQKRHNAADQAWAREIRIHRADLGAGDWRVEPASGDNAGAPQGCKDPDMSDLVETGKAQEPDFSRNGSFVGSGAAVFQTEGQATTAWNRVARQSLTSCLINAFKQALAGSGSRLRILFNGPLQMPKLAPYFSAGRVRLVFSDSGQKVDARFSFYLYARGRATALLMIASVGKPMQPISATLERHLAELVAQRLSR